MLTSAFLLFQAYDDPAYFRGRIGSYFDNVCIILHAPLDFLIVIITDGFNHEENLRKYKYEKKKHLFWDQVPEET
jgi:hypothetical protein